jgi:hypothetical protein
MQIRALHWILPIVVIAAGCENGSSSGPPAIEFEPPPEASGAGFVALYAPPVDVGPYPNDIYNLPGQTLSVPEKVTRPLVAALNTLDGFSTTAKITAPFNDRLDPTTLIPFDPTAPTGTETIFVFKVDGASVTPLLPGLHYSVQISTATGTNGSVLELAPLRPLEPKTTYAFLLTSGIESATGVSASADTVFGLVRDAHLANVMTGNPGLDALLPAIGPLVDLGLGLGLPAEAIVSAWSVSTQSTSDVLARIEESATAQASFIVPAGLSTAELGLGLPGLADIYVGFLEVPYFGNPADALGSVWVNASLEPPTREDPVPIVQGGLRRIPVFATLPNAASMQEKPAAGWPVVIVQHGVTVNRLVAVTLADAFAQAGFALVAIDLPLHGVTDITSPFYQGPGTPFGDNERHFNLDNVGAVGDFSPDGQIDNGWQIFNIPNPLNARDHARQAVSDLIHLARTLPTMDFDGDTLADLDGSRRHFVSLSLGSIFAMAYLAVSDDVLTATMSSPGGPLTGLLYDPEAINFGLPIRLGIEAQGLAFGSVAFDDFARDLQTVLDPIDAANYAATAAANVPMHIIEVLGDQSVTPALTDNLATIMGLEDVSTTLVDPAGARGIVRFTRGAHSSLFNPLIDFEATVEMQTQAVAFAGSFGTTILISDPALVQ